MQKNLLILCALITLFLRVRTTKYFNNIDFMTLGYDILKGYPLTQSGLDPGFKSTRIFTLTDILGTTDDTRFFIPRGTSVVKELSCQLSFTSEQISSEKKLQDQLKVQASISGDAWGAAFKASGEYQNMNSEFSSTNNLHVISQGECQVYRVWLNMKAPPLLSAYFIHDIGNFLLPSVLSGSLDLELYKEFIRIYGTHFLGSMTMGAKLSIIKNVNAEKGQTFGDTSTSLSAAASYSGMYSFSAEVMYSHQESSAEAFERQVTSTKTSTIGSRPPADGDVNTWAQQAFLDPMPLTYTLRNISELFDPVFLRREDLLELLPENFNVEEISRIYDDLQRDMGQVLTEYCKDVDSCMEASEQEYSSQFKLIASRTPTNGYDIGTYGEAFTNGFWGSKTQKIQIRFRNSDKTIQALRVILENIPQNTEPTWFGTRTEDQIEEEFVVPSGHRIKNIQFWTGPVSGTWAVLGVLFVLEDGQMSTLFGRAGEISFKNSEVVVSGILSGFHGNYNNEYIFSLGFISFDFLTPSERTKDLMFATPLYGKAIPCGAPFVRYNMDPNAIADIRFKSNAWVEGVGIKFAENDPFTWYGATGSNNEVSINTQDTFQFRVDSDGPDNDWVEGIVFFMGEKQVGTLNQDWTHESWDAFFTVSEADVGKLKLSGIYGRADNGGVCSIGFIYTRTYSTL